MRTTLGRRPAASEPARIYLHVGTPKSGTTYLQSRMVANHQELAAQGVLWPGPGWGRHVNAVRELVDLPKDRALDPEGRWASLAERARSWRGRAVVVSMEWMGSLRPHQVRAAVESLGPDRVEVICTARDLMRNFVAQAQEMAKNYRTWTWDQIEREVREGREGPAGRAFWAQQDVPRVLDLWAAQIPRDRIHLVTLPPPGGPREVLWERFCSVLGVDGSGFAEATASNDSLDVVSTALMQRLNVAAAEAGLPLPVYKRTLHRRVATQILGPRRDRSRPLGMSASMADFLSERSAEMVAELRQSGVDLVGSWEDLVPTGVPAGSTPGEVSDAEMLDLCVAVLVEQGVASDARIQELEAEVRELKAGSESGADPQAPGK